MGSEKSLNHPKLHVSQELYLMTTLEQTHGPGVISSLMFNFKLSVWVNTTLTLSADN